MLVMTLTILGLLYAAETMLARTKQQTKACSDEVYRQFDFWIGEWDVKVGDQVAGTSSVQLVSGSCALLENWTGSRGGDGRSLNYYDPATGQWRQLWVGSGGVILELAGEYKDNAMRLAGQSRRNGARILTKLTFFNLSPDRVRQVWEQSTDEGKTWSVIFDGAYSRRR
jgi:hypothetical protein